MAQKQGTRGLDLVYRDQNKSLAGVVAKVIYFNEDSLFCVASLDTETGPLIITGNLGRVKPGERLTLTGRFQTHAKYGRQFQADSFKVILPQEEDGIKAYLGSGLIKGLGPALAERIVARFKAEALEIMNRNPELLLEVEGIGPKKLKQIKQARDERREMEGLGLFLRSHDLPASLTLRLYKKYGNRALALVRNNPYVLIRDMAGIGFKKADNIAANLGHGPDSDQRLTAGLFHLLQDAADQGDCYLLEEDLLTRAVRLLGTDRSGIASVLERMIKAERLCAEVIEPEPGQAAPPLKTVYMPHLFSAEQTVAHGLLSLFKTPGPLSGVNPGPVLARIGRESELTFSPEQKEALKSVFTSKVLIITGGPGTGKTTLINALVRLFQSQEITPALAAPTGRAAKRLSLSAGEEASTIHRLLEYTPQEGFKRNRDNRLPHKAVLIDELSMVDLPLMASLMEALRPEASLILIGDADQLPAVGPGQVLEDLIRSGRIRVVRLVKVFRQAEGSTIVANAHCIRQGRPIVTEGAEDFYFINQEDSTKAAEIVVKLAAERIPRKFGLDPFQEIQVLSPMRKGVCGVEALNRGLRQALNPLGKNLENTGFRLGDKVIQTRNNYERMTFNGDLGLIRGQVGRGQLMIDMEGESKVYEGEGLSELVLAYCLSIHKAQGSEYPAVIIPILPEHTIMLRRNLIYTALTRARRLAVMVGSNRAFKASLGRSRQERRRTLLARRIREGWS